MVQQPLTASMLAEAMPQEQKQMLGERLFPLISSLYPDQPGKVTGMLLEMDNTELLHMLGGVAEAQGELKVLSCRAHSLATPHSLVRRN
mgnify:CR=1 FL=1